MGFDRLEEGTVFLVDLDLVGEGVQSEHHLDVPGVFGVFDGTVVVFAAVSDYLALLESSQLVLVLAVDHGGLDVDVADAHAAVEVVLLGELDGGDDVLFGGLFPVGLAHQVGQVFELDVAREVDVFGYLAEQVHRGDDHEESFLLGVFDDIQEESYEVDDVDPFAGELAEAPLELGDLLLLDDAYQVLVVVFLDQFHPLFVAV